MSLKVLFWAKPDQWPLYEPALRSEFNRRGIPVELVNETNDPASIEYIIYAPAGADDDLSPYNNVRLIQSLWAGPDKLIANPTLTQPLARMVDRGMSEGMVDYVVGNVLRHHLQTDRFAQANAGEWLQQYTPPLARNRVVGFLGLGALGMACARAVYGHGFKVMGWSKNPKADADILCFDGPAGLNAVLRSSDILVLLTPHTPDTENLINDETIAVMRPGTSIINPGRGPLIDDDALLGALNSGHISQATLDVFRTEPLPADHPYWAHPNVLVTPHIASETRVDSAVEVAVENIRRAEHDETPRFLVDRTRAY
jgi:glyoxylate/hydroxypyruvate reductase A